MVIQLDADMNNHDFVFRNSANWNSKAEFLGQDKKYKDLIFGHL